MSLANNPANFSKFKEWVTVRYGTPEKLEEAIRAGMKESYNRSKWNVGVEEAKKIFESAKEAAKTLFEKVSQA